jgi:hypothetical protein
MLKLRNLSTLGAVTVATAGLSGLASAQYVDTPGNIPQGNPFNNSRTENVDFGDTDLDGDWDAVFADGGDGGNDQNRIWINMGGAQSGTLGVYADRTGSLFPVIEDQSRDIEFLDFENDGDLDIYVSNTSQIQSQSNRWWVNQGLEQGGTISSYVDQTTTRWVGLGGAGSSVAPNQVLPLTGPLPGGFIDWSCDCDFADFDNDGDLDLFHSTYGSSFGGTVPSRIFLNDGDGFFTEFNPSGIQLTGATMPVGTAGIWCQGTFQPNTSNTTGANCDICTNTLDIDMGDIDGDLDLDILHGDRDSPTRFFKNRLEENGGSTLAFRDVSNQIYPGGWSDASGNYEQEMADVDGDNDLDLYGLNWGAGPGNDRMFRNNSGTFGNMTELVGSGSDDNEGDFADYDGDGDVDLFVANFSNGDKLYRNDDTGSGLFNFPKTQTINTGTSLDADFGDLDEDGDYDIMVASDGGGANNLLVNNVNNPDVTDPRFNLLESTANQTASTTPNPVRVQQYDNASYYTIWYNDTVLEVEVAGCQIDEFQMRNQGGWNFRGVIPGNLIGSVVYRARSTDEHGNTGVSSNQAYTGSDILGGSNFVFGSDSGAGAPQIRAYSVAFPNSTLYVGADGMTPGNAYFLAWNQSGLGSPLVLPGIAIVNVGGLNFFTFTGVVDGDGCAVEEIFMPPSVPSVSTYFQMFEWPGDGADILDSSRGLEVQIQ